MTKPQVSADLCVVNCYLAGHPKVVSFLNDFALLLREHGIELLVLATRELKAPAVPQLPIPYDLAGFDAKLAVTAGEPFHDVDESLESDRRWTGKWQPTEVIARGIAKCEWFYRQVASVLKPCAALIWNTTLPHSRIAQNTLRAAGVPAYCFERGQLPESYQVQTYELNAWNDIACNFALHAGLADDLARQSDEAFEAVRKHYLVSDAMRYPASSRLNRAALDEAYGTRGKKAVVVLGSAVGSSVTPTAVASIGYSQPLWGNAGEALHALEQSLARRDDVVVVFQDHPINVRLKLSPRVPRSFVQTHGVPVRDLLELADRVAVLGTSTVQYEALLLEKPVLLFGRSQLSQSGAAYSAPTFGLDRAVDDWLAAADIDRLHRNARALIGLLCERHLVAQDTSVPYIRNGAADLARFIASFKRPALRPIEQRLERFVERVLPVCRMES